MLTKMKIRCPDKPIRIAQDSLSSFDKEGGYIASYKLDGWRCIIDWNGHTVGFYSRRDVNSGGPTELPVCETLAEEVKQFLIANEIQPNTRLDSEWLARRTNGKEEIYIFGIQYLNGKWLGKDSEDLRFTIIETFKYDQPNVKLVPHTRKNYAEFFNNIKLQNCNLPEGKQRVEGIVLKRADSRLIGNLKICKKNNDWFKAKWRDGSSGYAPTF